MIMKKILHYVSKMNRAGQETFIMNMYREIDKSKFQFDFLLSDNSPGQYDNEILKKGGKLFYIDLNKNGHFKALKNYFLLRRKLYSLAKKEDIFYIHNHHAFDAYLSARAALKAGFKKVIVHSHSDSAEYHRWLSRLFRPLLSHLPVIEIAASEPAGKWLFSNDKFKIIKSGIKTQNFLYNKQSRNEIRKKLNIEDDLVVGNVGRFVPLKNHIFLIEVFKYINDKIPNSVLLLIGDGDEEQSIKEKVEKMGLDDKVIFLGSKGDVEKYYQAMDIYVFPSLFEGLGMTIIEAETAGLPCFISSVIPEEVNISPLVYRYSLKETPESWANKIILNINKTKDVDRINTSYKVQKKAVDLGLDINETCKEMEQIFLDPKI